MVFPITQIGSNWVCEVKDSDGNTIKVITIKRKMINIKIE